MAGRSKTHGSGTTKKARSRSSKAGLQFPVGRIARYLKLGKARRVNYAPVYLAAVLEYVAKELLKKAGNAAKFNEKTRIKPRHIQLVFKTEEELGKLAGEPICRDGGVMPSVHADLLPKKTGTSKATVGDDDS